VVKAGRIMNQTEIKLEVMIDKILADDRLHAKWLNTLSMLENVGARKISAYEDPRLVTEDVLKHALEESRHAWNRRVT
jgi:hypothetical protein